MRGVALSLLAASLVGGCAAARTPGWAEPPLPFGTVSTEILDHMVAEGDRAFAARENPASLDDAMESWGGALHYRPDDATLLVRLSRAARLRAHSLSSGDADGKLKEAIVFAERALSARNHELFNRVAARKPPANIFSAAEPLDVPALVAYAESLLEWTELRGTPTLLGQRDWINTAAVRAVELDRAADFGAPDRVLGVLNATLSSDLGGDLRASEEHFEAALAAAPGYLPTRLDYASAWCTRMRDQKRYQRLLAEVAGADADALPPAAPENRAAQKRARALLAEAKSW
jgi:hypothetical protein